MGKYFDRYFFVKIDSFHRNSKKPLYLKMNLNQIFGQYKDQPVFKIATIILILVFLVKIAMWGFHFGQWIAH